MKIVVLAEKPSQARDYRQALSGVTVVAARGHLLEHRPPKAYLGRGAGDYDHWNWARLPLLPDRLERMPKSDAKAELTTIAAALAGAGEVVIATDADAEGEAIAVLILDHLGWRGRTSRMWLASLDRPTIRRAFAERRPATETRGWALAAMVRSDGDWLVGMNCSPAATKALVPRGQKTVFPVGRVQTPTLALVARRDRAIADFKPTDYFEVVALVDAPDRAGAIRRVALRHAPDERRRLTDRAAAEAIAAAAQGWQGPLAVLRERVRQKPPPLFSLSGLQKKASALWGYGAQQTLDAAQALYERHKLTTYPRADCEHLPEAMAGDMPTLLEQLDALGGYDDIVAAIGGRPVIRRGKAGHFSDQAVAETSHHAIVPNVNVAPTAAALAGLGATERRLYDLIVRTTLAALLPDHERDRTTVSAPITGKPFRAVGSVPAVVGWTLAFARPDFADRTDASPNDANPGAEPEPPLPDLADGTAGTVADARVEAKRTKPPRPYTEGTLIAAMERVADLVDDPAVKRRLRETSGIGTQATRAGIIKELLRRGLLLKSGKALSASLDAHRLIGALETHAPALVDPAVTARWEDLAQDLIAGRVDPADAYGRLGRFVAGQVERLRRVIGAGADAADRPSGSPPAAAPPSPRQLAFARKLLGAHPGSAEPDGWRTSAAACAQLIDALKAKAGGAKAGGAQEDGAPKRRRRRPPASRSRTARKPR